jgi:SOS response regulatory protein OraA/RecX
VGKKLKSLNNYPSEIAKRRLYNLLLRRGYSSETIMKVLKDISNKEE